MEKTSQKAKNTWLIHLRNTFLANAIVTNTYLMLYPKESMVKLFNEQPNRLDEIFSILKNTKFEDIELNSRVYGGGLHKIEPKELPRVFLYSCPEWLRNVLQKNLLLT